MDNLNSGSTSHREGDQQRTRQRGHNARLEKASKYFYFKRGGATDWIDRTVQVPTVNSVTLAQWMEEFRSLKKLNAEIVCTPSRGGEAPQKPAR